MDRVPINTRRNRQAGEVRISKTRATGRTRLRRGDGVAGEQSRTRNKYIAVVSAARLVRSLVRRRVLSGFSVGVGVVCWESAHYSPERGRDTNKRKNHSGEGTYKDRGLRFSQ